MVINGWYKSGDTSSEIKWDTYAANTTVGSDWMDYSATGVNSVTIKAYSDAVTRTIEDAISVKYTSTDSVTTGDYDKYMRSIWKMTGVDAWTSTGTWAEVDYTGNAYFTRSGFATPLTPQQRFKQILRDRQAPATIIRSRQVVVGMSTDPREIRARETLHRVLGGDKFKKFMKNGFISVRARSGLVYQIFPGHGITNVYENGEKIERLCVVLKGNFPPTDSVIMRYLLILNDENDFRNHAVEHTVYKERRDKPSVISMHEPLNDVWNRLTGKKPVSAVA